MKSILFGLVFSIASVSLFSQGDFDERLLSKFDAEQIQDLQAKNSPSIAYWTFYLDNSYEIVDLPAGKSAEEFEQVKIKDIDNFNILDLDIDMARSTKKYFQIKGSDQILVLLSNEEFVARFNEYRSKN